MTRCQDRWRSRCLPRLLIYCLTLPMIIYRCVFILQSLFLHETFVVNGSVVCWALVWHGRPWDSHQSPQRWWTPLICHCYLCLLHILVTASSFVIVWLTVCAVLGQITLLEAFGWPQLATTILPLLLFWFIGLLYWLTAPAFLFPFWPSWLALKPLCHRNIALRWLVWRVGPLYVSPSTLVSFSSPSPLSPA